MNKRLLELLTKYPNAQVIPMVNWDNHDGDYRISTTDITNIEYLEYIEIDNQIYQDKDEALERLYDKRYNDMDFNLINKYEQWIIIDKEYNKYIQHKAIFIYIG